MIDWSPLKDLIETHDRFLVTTHVRPDGDALGSEVGMAGLLRQKGKDVRVVNASPTPPRYAFLDPDETLFEWFGTGVKPAGLADREVAIILDLSSWNQLGDMAELIRRFPGPRAIIDHHVSQDDLGAVVFKDSTAEATGILVMSAFPTLGGQLTPEISQGLFTAIAMDTGWFHHSRYCVPELCEPLPSWSIRAPDQPDLSRTFRAEYTFPPEVNRRNAAGVENRSRRPRGICDHHERRSVSKRGNSQDSEDLVDFTVSLKGVELGLLFIEQLRGGAKVSIRTRSGVDCAALAAQFGGGGHKEAAGATINAPMTECVERVLEAVRKTLGA